MEIMAAHKIPYAATSSVAFPDDLTRRFRKAAGVRGARFTHLLSPCPPGWRIPPEASIRVTRLATRAKGFPVCEIEGGDHYRINVEPEGTPVSEYLGLQGRFDHLDARSAARIQERVDCDWERLLARAMMRRFGES